MQMRLEHECRCAWSTNADAVGARMKRKKVGRRGRCSSMPSRTSDAMTTRETDAACDDLVMAQQSPRASR
eukprot:2195221-Pleurochrysis_carterae.AAC.1